MTSIVIAALRAEIWARDLTNTKQEQRSSLDREVQYEKTGHKEMNSEKAKSATDLT
jgi:hypothetical protein